MNPKLYHVGIRGVSGKENGTEYGSDGFVRC
jgi:hypothetical protein